MKNDKNDKIDGRFENYRGTKRFCVSHPDYSPTLTIAAPCEAAAIVAAAQKWGGAELNGRRTAFTPTAPYIKTMTNEYGVILDRNGYAPSIVQDIAGCYYCATQCGTTAGARTSSGHTLGKITFKENAYERKNSYQSGRA